MEERDMSGSREEVGEGTEQERIQNEEEVLTHPYFYAYTPLTTTGDQHPLLTSDTSQLSLTFCWSH